MSDLISNEDFESQQLKNQYASLMSNTASTEVENTDEAKPVKKARKTKEKTASTEAKKPTSPITDEEEMLIFKNYRHMTNAKLAALLVDNSIEKGIEANFTESQIIKFSGEKRKEFTTLMADPTISEEDKASLQALVTKLQKEKVPSTKKKLTINDIYALKQKYLD